MMAVASARIPSYERSRGEILVIEADLMSKPATGPKPSREEVVETFANKAFEFLGGLVVGVSKFVLLSFIVVMILAVIAISLVAFPFALHWMSVGAKSPFQYGYEVAVEIETPEGIMTGYGYVGCSITVDMYDARARWCKNDADLPVVTVDLGEKGVLTILTAHPDGKEGYLPEFAETVAKMAGHLPNMTEETAKQMPYNAWVDLNFLFWTEPTEVPVEALPLMVVARDAADPTTSERVEQGDLGTLLGPGYQLSHVTVTMLAPERPLPKNKGEADLMMKWFPFPEWAAETERRVRTHGYNGAYGPFLQGQTQQ
jgi:hypothetical protein